MIAQYDKWWEDNMSEGHKLKQKILSEKKEALKKILIKKYNYNPDKIGDFDWLENKHIVNTFEVIETIGTHSTIEWNGHRIRVPNFVVMFMEHIRDNYPKGLPFKFTDVAEDIGLADKYYTPRELFRGERREVMWRRLFHRAKKQGYYLSNIDDWL